MFPTLTPIYCMFQIRPTTTSISFKRLDALICILYIPSANLKFTRIYINICLKFKDFFGFVRTLVK